jgi:DNA primase
VVESIAKIPDPIKRSVFIKQTSSMLDTDEQVLIAETNRIRLKGNEKVAKQIDQEFENLFINEDGISERNINVNESREKALIRSLILFGNLPLDEEQLVVKFILNEIATDELEFDTPQFNEVISIAKEYFDLNGFVDEYFFKNNEKTTHLASDIILDSQKHLLSENWALVAEKIVKQELDNYKEEIIDNLNYLKFSHVMKLIKLNSEKLKENLEEDAQREIIEVQMNLIKVKNELAALKGIIIH